MMRKEQNAEMKKLITKMKGLFSRIIKGHSMGEYDKVLKYIEQEEQLIKRFQGDLPKEIKAIHNWWLWYRALINAYKGDLALSFKAANELLRIAQLYDDKRGISNGEFSLGRYYGLSGDLDTALVHLDRAIRLSEENLNDILDFAMLAFQLYFATRFSIDMEDLERAKKYFKRLKEIRELQSVSSNINDTYRLAKALLLKSSIRFRDRVMAEDLFGELIEDASSDFMYKLKALSELCELLLVELKLSDNTNLISEIKPLLDKLIDMAQKAGLHYFLIEAYILHGKLSLITFDMESSRRYLMEAQRMAERHGYIGLVDEIAGLHEAMMEKKDTWEQMEKINAPISERMELARLDDHLKGKFRRLMMKMERAADAPPKKEVF